MSIDLTQLPTLNQQQSAVYLAALELGTDTVQHIAKKASLPRSTTYLVIDELISKGLLSSSKRGKKKLIAAESPDKLVQLAAQASASLNQARKNLENDLPKLLAIQNTRKNKPLVSFYEGFEGIKTILELTYASSEILVACSGSEEEMDPSVEEYMYDEYLPKTNELKVKTREIVTQDSDLERYLNSYANELHEIRVSSRKPASHHIDKLIFQDCVAMVDYDSLNGTIMKHEHIATFEKVLFDQLWKALEK